MIRCNIERVHKDAVVPTYATDGSGAFDLSCTDAGVVGINSHTFGTGWKFEIPKGYVMLVFSRSGHGFNQGIRLANCVGVIDSDYRGEVKVRLKSDMHVKEFYPGDRIAQALILPIEQVEFSEVEALSETNRGEGGFGSTG